MVATTKLALFFLFDRAQLATMLRLLALVISISVFFPWLSSHRRERMRIFFLHWARCACCIVASPSSLILSSTAAMFSGGYILDLTDYDQYYYFMSLGSLPPMPSIISTCLLYGYSGVMYVLSQFIMSVMVLNCWSSRDSAGPFIYLLKFWELTVLNLWSISSLAIALLIANITRVGPVHFI